MSSFSRGRGRGGSSNLCHPPARRAPSSGAASRIQLGSVGLTQRSSSSSASAAQLNNLNRTVNRIRSTIDEQMQRHSDELTGEGGGLLLQRAQRLQERLEVLKRKLSMCFQYGEDLSRMRGEVAMRSQTALRESYNSQPESLRRDTGTGHDDDGFEHYDPAAFLFAEAQAHATGGTGSLLIRTAPTNLMTPQIVLEQMAAVEADDAPEDFVCPITQCVMVDPVFTSDGNIYERAAITEWFRSFQMRGKVPTSPLTNLELTDSSLTPCPDLRKEIQRFMDDSVKKQKLALMEARKVQTHLSGNHTDAESRKKDREDASSAFEEPSLRLLGQQRQVDIEVSDTRPAVPKQLPPPSPVLQVAPPTIPAPTHASRTIDVAELRRAFQLQQQQQSDSKPPLQRSSSHNALLAHARLVDGDASDGRNQSSLRSMLQSHRNASALNTIFNHEDLADAAQTVPNSSQPIWGSSVVPLHEPNSRVLNLLRVRDDVVEGIDDVPGPGPMQVTSLGGGVGRAPSGTVHLSRSAQRLEAARREATARAHSQTQRTEFPEGLYRVPPRPNRNADTSNGVEESNRFRPPLSGLQINAQRLEPSSVARRSNPRGGAASIPVPPTASRARSLNTRVTRR